MLTENTTTPLEDAELLLKSKVKRLVDFYYLSGIEEQEIHEAMDRLLNCYVVSDFIENDDREARDRIVCAIMDLNRIIKMLEEIKKLDILLTRNTPA